MPYISFIFSSPPPPLPPFFYLKWWYDLAAVKVAFSPGIAPLDGKSPFLYHGHPHPLRWGAGSAEASDWRCHGCGSCNRGRSRLRCDTADGFELCQVCRLVAASPAGLDAGGHPWGTYTPGMRVVLAEGYHLCEGGVAAGGPLRPGDVGVIDDAEEHPRDNLPYKVSFRGRSWWYPALALVPLGSLLAAPPLPASVRGEVRPRFGKFDALYEGDMVKRGPDWHWGDQDNGGSAGRVGA